MDIGYIYIIYNWSLHAITINGLQKFIEPGLLGSYIMGVG